MPKRDYAYRFTPTGDSKDIVVQWIKTQKTNKADSFSMLIRQAINKYGMTDIVKMTNDAFLNDEINKAKPTSAYTMESKTNNNPENNENQPETKNKETREIPNSENNNNIKENPLFKKKKNKKADTGFLSK